MKPSLKYCIYCTCEKYVRNKVRKRANPFPQHGISGFYSLVFFVTFQSLEKLSLPLSLKSSTSMTSVMSCGGERLSTLWTVLSRDDQPSLWKGMMILVLGSFSAYSFCLQLDTHTHVHRQNRNRCSTLANTYINTAYSRKDKSILFISCILPGIILFFVFLAHLSLQYISGHKEHVYISALKWMCMGMVSRWQLYSFHWNTGAIFSESSTQFPFYHLLLQRQLHLFTS